MKRKNANTREVTFFSEKCGEVISTFGTAARALAERLERDGQVLKYQSKVLVHIDPSTTPTLGIRNAYIKEDWFSDFSVETVEGEIYIIEAIFSDDLRKKSEVEKVELSRRYWMAKGISWRLCIIPSPGKTRTTVSNKDKRSDSLYG